MHVLPRSRFSGPLLSLAITIAPIICGCASIAVQRQPLKEQACPALPPTPAGGEVMGVFPQPRADMRLTKILFVDFVATHTCDDWADKMLPPHAPRTMEYKPPSLRRSLRAERVFDLGGYLARTGKLHDVAQFVWSDPAPAGMQRVDMTIESTGDYFKRDIETFTMNQASDGDGFDDGFDDAASPASSADAPGPASGTPAKARKTSSRANTSAAVTSDAEYAAGGDGIGISSGLIERVGWVVPEQHSSSSSSSLTPAFPPALDNRLDWAFFLPVDADRAFMPVDGGRRDAAPAPSPDKASAYVYRVLTHGGGAAASSSSLCKSRPRLNGPEVMHEGKAQAQYWVYEVDKRPIAASKTAAAFVPANVGEEASSRVFSGSALKCAKSA